MNQDQISVLTGLLKEQSVGKPLIIRSPGRINFIGEHTDYNEGFVLPSAINMAIYIAVVKTDKNNINFISADLNDYYELPVHNISITEKQWVNYLAGTVAEMQKAGYSIGGFNCAFGGNIPVGAGLSSSAAIAAGLAFAVNQLFDLNIPKIELARFAQLAEHNYAGVKCGIMDQFANLFSEDGKVIKLDCRDLSYETIQFNYPDLGIFLCDSGIKHTLAASEYNIRRSQCEEGVSIIRQKYPVRSLRDVNIDMLYEFEGALSPDVWSRCLYVIEEIERVHLASEYLRLNEIKKFGELLPVTHEGLRMDYDVSIPEIDNLVYSALDLDGVLGSRMMGGGFGGCTINLVEKAKAEDFKISMINSHKKQTGSEMQIYECKIAPGTEVM